MPPTGFVSSETFLQHDTGPAHPERPERLRAVHARLEATGLLAELERLDAPPAAGEWLDAVHAPGHAETVRRATAGEAGALDADTIVGPASWEAALRAVGGALAAADRIVRGEWQNAFVAARPPGHHAESSRAMGFCLFNNAVICARYLQREHGLERVAILDWDVHHGNGTQHLTEDDPTVHYTSLHQFPHYPGTGAADEVGRGEGEGSVLNCPMPAGSGDREWLAVYEERVLPTIEDFAPDFVIVSAGFDAHLRDPLSSTRLSAQGFERMSAGVLEVARRSCGARLLSLLEGGYDLEGLAESVEAHLRALRGAD